MPRTAMAAPAMLWTPRTSARALAGSLCAFLLLAQHTYAEIIVGHGRIPFWIELAANRQVDPQIENIFGARAAIVVMRPILHGTEPKYDLRNLIERLHRRNPDVPVLLYALINRHWPTQAGGNQVIQAFEHNPEYVLNVKLSPRLPLMMDITRGEYRKHAVEALSTVVLDMDADGVAVDLAVRNPLVLQKQRCRDDDSYCRLYAKSTDAAFRELRAALGSKGILFNGISNAAPGMLEDQLKLLEHADAAIIEFFGMNPWGRRHSFRRDVLPYLIALQQVPNHHNVFVFGRAPWTYRSYVDDYLWQRYLYCAYLLAARENTFFKYHASFQVPAHAGRSGALAIYADWSLNLGRPLGDFEIRDGVYSRRFENGLTVVNPDDGSVKQFSLPGEFVAPEGQIYRGLVDLNPGVGLLLLNRLPIPRLPTRAIALEELGDWEAARWESPENQPAYLRVMPIEHPGQVGEHDVLLDFERTMQPYQTLSLRLRKHSRDARVVIVAEVDDKEGKYNYALISLASDSCAPGFSLELAPLFRAASESRSPWPRVCVAGLSHSGWSEIQLNGNALLRPTNLVFRRWWFMRIVGGLDVAFVRLSNP